MRAGGNVAARPGKPGGTRKRLAQFLAYSVLFGLAVSVVSEPESGLARTAASPLLAAPQPMTAVEKLPLAFEENRGQVDRRVKFLSRGRGYSLFLTLREAVIVLGQNRSTVHLRPVGGNHDPRVSGRDRLPGKSNYLVAKDPSQWHTDIPNYARVVYVDVYPGIDLAYYGSQTQLEYDWIVRPGADPGAIHMAFSGGQQIRLESGELIIDTAAGELRNQRPVAYQEINGIRRPVVVNYSLDPGQIVSFAPAAYDKTRPLVIDPTLTYAALVGGHTWPPNPNPPFVPIPSPGMPWGSAIDAAGNVYLGIENYATDFPMTGGIGPPRTALGRCCFYAVKLNASGTAILFSTQIGMEGEPTGLALDSAGNIYIGGRASSLPTTPGAFQPVPRGQNDAFILKLNPTGSALVYSTFIGGNGLENGRAIAVDAAGNAYLSGWTRSTDFPTTPGALQTCSGFPGGLFVTKMNSQGTGLVYSVCIGGTMGPVEGGLTSQVEAMTVDTAGSVYVTGETWIATFPTTAGSFQSRFPGNFCISLPCAHGFVFKLDPAGSRFLYSTFIAGSAGAENAKDIAVDALGNAYITGITSSPDFPTTPGAFQRTLTVPPGSCIVCAFNAFVTKLNAAGSALVYSTYIGGSGGNFSAYDPGGTADVASSIALDLEGNAYVTGYTDSTDFPLVNPIQAVFGAGTRERCAPLSTFRYCEDAFILKMNSTGTALLYSTYLGGVGADWGWNIAADGRGNAYVIGQWGRAPSLFQTEEIGVFVVKLADSGRTPPLFAPNGVTNAASYRAAFAQGGIATIFGTNLTTVNGILTANSLPLPTELAGTVVLVNGIRAPIFAVANVNGLEQINFQTPTNLDFRYPPSVVVNNNGARSVPIFVNVGFAAPGIFTTDGTRGAIQHGLTNALVTAVNPAERGEVIVVYATGLGPVQPDPGVGNPARVSPLSVNAYAVSATISGVAAEVLFSGLAPGFVGLNQVNVRVPENLPSGDAEVVVTARAPDPNFPPMSSPPVKLAVR